MVEGIETIRYDWPGEVNIYLENVPVRNCPECGEKLISIPKMAQLHRIIKEHLT